jgi:hypothetical protein
LEFRHVCYIVDADESSSLAPTVNGNRCAGRPFILFQTLSIQRVGQLRWQKRPAAGLAAIKGQPLNRAHNAATA